MLEREVKRNLEVLKVNIRPSCFYFNKILAAYISRLWSHWAGISPNLEPMTTSYAKLLSAYPLKAGRTVKLRCDWMCTVRSQQIPDGAARCGAMKTSADWTCWQRMDLTHQQIKTLMFFKRSTQSILNGRGIIVQNPLFWALYHVSSFLHQKHT